MARSDKTKVIKRSDKFSPITQNEMDENLQQIRNVIDDVTELETNQSDFLRKDDSLSEIADPSVGRAALDVYSKAESDNRYLQKSANLSDLDDKAASRNNLDVYSKAESDSLFGTMATRDLYISPSNPTDTDGSDGDVWFVYEAPAWYCPVPDSNYWFNNNYSFYAMTMNDGSYISEDQNTGAVYPYLDKYSDQIGRSIDGDYTTSSYAEFQPGFKPEKVIAIIRPTDIAFQFNGWSDISMAVVSGSGGGGIARSVSMTKAELEAQTGQPFNMNHCYRLEIVIDPEFYGEIDWLEYIAFSAVYGQSYLIDLEFYKNGERVYPS